MNKCRRNLLICFSAGAMAVATLFGVGCGKKAMPVPPNRIMPAAVSNFKGQLKEERVLLTWSLPERSGDDPRLPQNLPLAEVRVYRSKLPLEEGGCKNCPLRFETIATLPPAVEGRREMRYSDNLERGFRYTYKIVLVGENGAVSPDSDLLDVTY